MSGWVLAALGLALVVGAGWFDYEKRKARRKSLRRDDSGGWIWTDFDGSERRSESHPGEPGGDWASSDGGGGGESGGDGGGGD